MDLRLVLAKVVQEHLSRRFLTVGLDSHRRSTHAFKAQQKSLHARIKNQPSIDVGRAQMTVQAGQHI